jgi:hypothetical protein
MIAVATRCTSIAAILVLVAGVPACGGPDSDPEAEIRAWVDAMEQAASDEARRDIVAGISPAYVDGRGNSRDDVDRMLRVVFLRNDAIGLMSSIDEIEVIDGSAATVDLTVAMAGLNDSALGIGADAYRFELELEHDGDDWRLISARWGELGSPLR